MDRKLITAVLAGGGGVAAPAWYDGATFWVEADQGDLEQSDGGSPVASDGDPIGAVPHHEATIDSGGKFTQTVTASKPTYKINIMNGNPVMRFDGGDYLRNAALSAITDTQGLFVVVGSSSAANSTYWCSADEATTSFYIFGLRNSASPDKYRIWQKNNDVDDNLDGGNAENSDSHIIEWGSSGTGYSIRVDNTLLSLSIASGSDYGDWLGDTANRDSIGIGVLFRTSAAFQLTGDIAALAYFPTVAAFTDTARQTLATKYGITLS